MNELALSCHDDVSERELRRFITFSLLWFSLYNLLQKVLMLPDSSWQMVTMVYGVVLLLAFVPSFLILLGRVPQTLIVSLLALVIIYATSYLAFPESLSLLGRGLMWSGMAWCIAIATYGIVDYRALYRSLVHISYLIVAVAIFPIIHHFAFVKGEMEYDINFSYAMALPTIIHLAEFARIRKSAFLLLFLLECAILLAVGVRGVFVCIAVAGLLLFFTSRIDFLSKFICTVLLIFVGGICYFFKAEIGQGLYELFAAMGFESRTLHMMAVSDTEGITLSRRSIIWGITWSLIKSRPLLGWGLGGGIMALDRGLTAYYDVSTYPHNLYLEMMLDFGIPIGLGLSLWLLFSPLKLKRLPAKWCEFRYLFIIFYAVGNVALWFSSQYFRTYAFFVFVALLLRLRHFVRWREALSTTTSPVQN